MAKRRIGVMTGGGDCPGLNAVIRAVVKAIHLQHDWEVMGIYEGFDGLIRHEEPNVTVLEPASVRGLLHRGGTMLGTSMRGDPFHYPVDQGEGGTIYDDVSETVLRRVEGLGLGGLVVIGGHGTLDAARQLAAQGLDIVGVPKTVENDLTGTDITFGFDTAVHVAMEAIDRLHTTAESHHRAMILEVMGRDAGWIALHSGLAGGTDAILIPELPYDVWAVAEKLERRRERGSSFATIVVAQGARPIGGDLCYIDPGRQGAKLRLGGAGVRFARALEKAYGIETRTTVLGYLQRGGSPSPKDRILATRFGTHAVDLLASRSFGRMVSLRGTDVVDVPLDDALGKRVASPDGPVVGSARAIGICMGD